MDKNSGKTQEKVKFSTKFKNFCVKLGQGFLDLFYPPKIKCIFCGVDIPNFEEQPYCDKCKSEGVLNNGKRCRICDCPIYDEKEVCDHCASHKKVFQKAFCPFVYTGRVRSAILRLKNDNAKYLAPIFAKLMCDRILQEGVTVDIIVPVPSHIKTIKKRGYNQAALIADEMGKILGCPVSKDNIRKTKLTKEQKNLTFKERQKNLIDSFSIASSQEFEDKNVLIVDDIITTGATMNAVSSLIRKKAKNIYVSAFARRDITDSKSYRA